MIAPNHIAIIMDGNGRWGLKKFKSRLLGHKQGIENIKPIVNHCIKKISKLLHCMLCLMTILEIEITERLKTYSIYSKTI